MDIYPKSKALVNLRSPLLRNVALVNRLILHLQSMHNIHLNILLSIYLKYYFFVLHHFLSVFISHTSLLLFFSYLPSFLTLAILNIFTLRRNNVIPIHESHIKPLNKYLLLQLLARAFGFTRYYEILIQ